MKKLTWILFICTVIISIFVFKQSEINIYQRNAVYILSAILLCFMYLAEIKKEEITIY